MQLVLIENHNKLARDFMDTNMNNKLKELNKQESIKKEHLLRRWRNAPLAQELTSKRPFSIPNKTECRQKVPKCLLSIKENLFQDKEKKSSSEERNSIFMTENNIVNKRLLSKNSTTDNYKTNSWWAIEAKSLFKIIVKAS